MCVNKYNGHIFLLSLSSLLQVIKAHSGSLPLEPTLTQAEIKHALYGWRGKRYSVHGKRMHYMLFGDD